MTRKEGNDEIQRTVYFIKDELQSFIERNIPEGSKKENLYWLHTDGLKLLLTMNPVEKLKNTMNKTSDNMTYLIYNKKFLCQNKKLHPLISKRENGCQKYCIALEFDGTAMMTIYQNI